MSNPFSKEKELINMLVTIEQTIKKLQLEVAGVVLRKGEQTSIPMAKELRQKCIKFGQANDKLFTCRYCQRTFTEGRQLGGHISRAHKEQHLKDKGTRTKSEEDDDYEEEIIARKIMEQTKATKQKPKKAKTLRHRRHERQKASSSYGLCKIQPYSQQSGQQVFLQDQQ